MVGLELLTSPVGPTEVMMIVRLGLPRLAPLLLPGPILRRDLLGPRLLRLLTRFQLLRGNVNLSGKQRAGRGIHLQQTPQMCL